MMKVKCAWCGRDMGEKMGPDWAVTHGICPECMEKVLDGVHNRTEVCPDHGRYWPVPSNFSGELTCPACDDDLVKSNHEENARPVNTLEKGAMDVIRQGLKILNMPAGLAGPDGPVADSCDGYTIRSDEVDHDEQGRSEEERQLSDDIKRF
jgi:hypothetical protein